MVFSNGLGSIADVVVATFAGASLTGVLVRAKVPLDNELHISMNQEVPEGETIQVFSSFTGVALTISAVVYDNP